MKTLTFEDWMKQIDDNINEQYRNVSLHDLGDHPYRSWYDSGVSPKQAVLDATGLSKYFDYIDKLLQ